MSWRDRMLDRWGLVLILLTTSLVVIALVGDRSWGVTLAVVIQAGTALLILRAAGVHKNWHRLMQVMTGVAVIAAVIALVTPSSWTNVLAAVILLILLAMGPVAIGARLRTYDTVGARTVYAVLCIFLIFGMFFGVLYQVVGVVSPDPFFSQIDDARSFDFIYFSFVTLTTLGYGDLAPADDVGRALAVLEALVGTIYLVTIVALVVANLGRSRKNPLAADTPEIEGDET